MVQDLLHFKECGSLVLLFLGLVKRVWSSKREGSAMSQLIFKLKFLKKELKDWNSTVFGDLYKNIVAAQDKLASIELLFYSEKNWML